MTLCCVLASAQTTKQEFVDKYNLLTGKLGLDGVGVETLLTKWEAAFPEDQDMLEAFFLYYYTKCQTQGTTSSYSKRYLGQEPILELKDSLGKSVYYFYDYEYDDEMFGQALSYLERANRAQPAKLENRLAQVTALLNYEKESPDLALAAMTDLIAENYASKPEGTYAGEPVDGEEFISYVQDYCLSFYRIGSDASYEAFRKISEEMLRHEPSSHLFLDNMGTYSLVFRKDNKAALKYYDKALKIKPDDMVAIQNCVIISRRQGSTKLEKKYLAMMVEYAEEETARQSAKVRLDYLNGSKGR